MKGQSSIEFITVYGFMLIIAALFIALIVLFAFSAQDSIQTSQCSGYSGLYCTSAQVAYNVVARNSLVYLALDSEQSAPVNIIGINVIINNATYAGTCNPTIAAPAERVNCTIGVNSITRNGQQIVGSYTINGQYCNSPVYNVSVEACAYQNVTYTGFFSTYVTNHLSLGYTNYIVPANVVGVVSGSFCCVEGIAFAPSGSYAYATEFNTNRLAIINTATNSLKNTISPGLNVPYGVAFVPSGDYAYVANLNFGGFPYISVVDTATETQTGKINIEGVNLLLLEGVAVSPNGANAWLSGYGNVLELNTATNTMTQTSTDISSSGLVVSPDGQYVYVIDLGTEDILKISTTTGDVVSSIGSSMIDNPSGIAITPDGKYLYLANTDSNQVLIISTATGNVISTINNGFSQPSGIAIAPGGSYGYVGNPGYSNVVIIDTGGYN